MSTAHTLCPRCQSPHLTPTSRRSSTLSAILPRRTPPLPPEILLLIITSLTSPQDLLSLALTSHFFAALIIPLHVRYRALRCRFRDDQLWKELLSSPAKCGAIHRLAVLDRAGDRAEYRVDWTRREKYRDRFPPSERPGQVAPHADDQLAMHHGSDALCRLAPSFKKLRSLTMYLPAMCFVRLKEFWREVSPRLEACHLRLSFMHPAVMPEHRRLAPVVAQEMASARFRIFSLMIEEYRTDVIERVLRSFARLLRKCDDLEHLCIEVENAATTSYQCAELWKARWLKLLSLDLSGLRMEEVDEFDEFTEPGGVGGGGELVAHPHTAERDDGLDEDEDNLDASGAEQPNIEQFFLALHSLQTLRLDCYAPRTPTIRPDSMPSLRAVGLLGSTLEVQWAMLPTLVSPLSDGSYRPIDSLQWDLKYYPFADTRSGTVFRLFCHHLARAGTLRQVMLVRSAYGTESFPWVREFGKAVPGIEHFVIDPDGIMSFETWLELLSAYPCLITLNPTNNGIHHPFLKPFSSNFASLALSRASGGPAGHHGHSYLGMSGTSYSSYAGYGGLGVQVPQELPNMRAELGLEVDPDLGEAGVGMELGVGGMAVDNSEDKREEGMLYQLSTVCPQLRHVDAWIREDVRPSSRPSSSSSSSTAGPHEGAPAAIELTELDQAAEARKAKVREMGYVWRKRDMSRPCERDCCRLRPPYVRERT